LTYERDEAVRILRERAARLAQRPSPADPGACIDALEFELAGGHYAIDTVHLNAVHRLEGVTPLPGAPAYAPGVVCLRGRILPVIDLNEFLDLPRQASDQSRHLIAVHCGQIEVGMLADTVVGIRQVQATSLQSPQSLAGIRAGVLQGITDGRVALLDLARLFADPRITGETGV